MAAAAASAGLASPLQVPHQTESLPEGVEEFLRATRPLGISDRWAERFWVQKKGRHDDALAGAKSFKAAADEYGIWTAGLDEEAIDAIM